MQPQRPAMCAFRGSAAAPRQTPADREQRGRRAGRRQPRPLLCGSQCPSALQSRLPAAGCGEEVAGAGTGVNVCREGVAMNVVETCMWVLGVTAVRPNPHRPTLPT